MPNETILNNRYRLISQLGSGGMAVIYEAIDESLQRTVAIKVLRPSLVTDPTFITRFQNEARSIANLSHPNIVTVHDVGNDTDRVGNNTHYMVMEYVKGQDLKKIIRTSGALTLDMALYYAIQICAGIGFAHRAGLVHADVKPQNILLTRDNVVKVTDFGIAQALTEHTQPMERQSVVWGSPHYFAPEQARGERPTAASDVYSIGIVMFEMFTGRLPFTGNNQQELALAHLRETPPPITEYNPHIPNELARIVEKVLQKEPKARYRTADQLGHVLIGYRERGEERTINAPASSPAEVGSNRNRRDDAPPPPTQKLNVAPEAPGPDSYVRPPAPVQSPINYGQPEPRPMDAGDPRIQPMQQGYNAPQPPPQPTAPFQREQAYYDSRPSRPMVYDVPPQNDVAGVDWVTILLAILAFVAVVGLIVLYIGVLNAYT